MTSHTAQMAVSVLVGASHLSVRHCLLSLRVVLRRLASRSLRNVAFVQKDQANELLFSQVVLLEQFLYHGCVRAQWGLLTVLKELKASDLLLA